MKTTYVYESLYGVGETVMILALKEPAVIRAIQFEAEGTTYRVYYWNEGELRTVWLFASDLGAYDGK